ncbi:MAG: hypothetical protein OXH69_10570 [Acidobacteria bacterium]|nr:hypothetical protein [Acidobacteriota bacterium]
MSCYRDARYGFELDYPVDWRMSTPGLFARSWDLLTGSGCVMTLRGPDMRHLNLVAGPQIATHSMETFRAEFTGYANRRWGRAAPAFESLSIDGVEHFAAVYETPLGFAKKYSVVTPRRVELAFTALLSVRNSEASRAGLERREAEYDAIVCSVRYSGGRHGTVR